MLRSTLFNHTLICINDPNCLDPYSGVSLYSTRPLYRGNNPIYSIINKFGSIVMIRAIFWLSPYCNRLSYNIPYVACPRCISNENRVEYGTQVIGEWHIYPPTKRSPIINIYIFVFSGVQLNMCHLKQVVQTLEFFLYKSCLFSDIINPLQAQYFIIQSTCYLKYLLVGKCHQPLNC